MRNMKLRVNNVEVLRFECVLFLKSILFINVFRRSTKKAIETLFAENFGLRKIDKGLYFMQCGSAQDSFH